MALGGAGFHAPAWSEFQDTACPIGLAHATQEAFLARTPITPEDFYLLRQVGDARISPDGGSVAYVLTEPDRAKNSYRNTIYRVDAAGGTPRRLTQGGVRGDTH